MSRLAETFSELERRGSCAYIPYICAGDPDLNFTAELVRTLDKSGADIFEIGLPFSDPIADGPVIQAAMKRSLAAGFRTKKVFELISDLRKSSVSKPFVVMSYFNPIFKYGVERFCESLSSSGGDALLVVDLPPEESQCLRDHCRNAGLDIIRLITPTTEESRLDYLLSDASGYVYAVSVAGTTGQRDNVHSNVPSLIEKIRGKTDLPIAIGFGISRPEHVRLAVSMGSSGVIEGSQLASMYSEDLDDRDRALRNISEHAESMKSSTKSK
ncbi:MAG: tryptophan synthase subunit alpha [Thermoplasmata archaeon]|nr:tryptophan synthase subunit alpha [Thermoplasmata archaeon]